MIFKCGLCEKTKWGQHSTIQYRALTSSGKPKVYSMKICEDCANEIEKGQGSAKPERDDREGD